MTGTRAENRYFVGIPGMGEERESSGRRSSGS